MIVEIFDNGDDAFLDWIARHPDGYVLNRRRGGLSQNYLVLHTSSCEYVVSSSDMAEPGGFTTRKYIKVYSADLPALHEYVRAHCGRLDGSFTSTCRKCIPNPGTPRSQQKPLRPLTIKTLAIDAPFTEGRVEDYLQPWLESNGYSVEKRVRVLNGIIDIVAKCASGDGIIEAKGEDKGGYNSAEMNFRIGISQICSRMENGSGKIFGLAIPMTTHFKKVLLKHRNFSVFEHMKIWLVVASADGAITALAPGDVQKYVDNLRP